MKAAVYARRSTPDEENIDQQVERGRATCERAGWEIVAELTDDGVSAWKEDAHRPAFEELLELARGKRVDVVVVRNVDRLARRNSHAWVELESLGVKIAEHGGQPMSSLEALIKLAIAQEESRVKSERQLAREDRRIEEGLPPRGGHRHFGYDRSHEVVPDEAEVIRELADRWLAGETLRGLARELNERGLRTTLGNEWTYKTVKKMLQSPRLAAIRVHRRDGNVTYHRGAWEPIITEDLHHRLVAADAQHRTGRAPGRYLLTGLLVCGRESCGRTLNGKNHRPGTRRYNCYGCHRNGIGAEEIEDHLWNEALGRVYKRDRYEREDVERRLAVVEKELDERRGTRDELDTAYWQRRDVDRATYLKQYADLTAAVESLEAEADELRRERDEEATYWKALLAVADRYESATPEEKRVVLRRALVRVVLRPADPSRNWSGVDLDRLEPEWRV